MKAKEYLKGKEPYLRYLGGNSDLEEWAVKLMEEYHKAKVNEITDEMIEKIDVDPYTDSVDFDCGYEQGFEKGAKWFKEQLNVQ